MDQVFTESRLWWKPALLPLTTSPLSGLLKSSGCIGIPGNLQFEELSLSTDKRVLSMRLRLRGEIGWYHEAFSSLCKEHVSLCRDGKAFCIPQQSKKGGGRIGS